MRTAAEPVAPRPAPSPEAALRRCPYPGLRPFEMDESQFFFGREQHVDDMLCRLQSRQFLAVVGDSGAGKSSLVRAGLLPALKLGFFYDAGADWRFIVMRPGADPFLSLAKELLKLSGDDEGPRSGTVEQQALLLESIVRRSSQGIGKAIAEQNRQGSNILLVVDQFEELFRLGRRQRGEQRWRNDASLFVRGLLAACSPQQDAPVSVVITMRTDFIGECGQFSELPEALNDGQFLVPRLTRRQLRRAIFEPARMLGVCLQPKLVQRLLNDRIGFDELPVLQHTLMRVWQRWEQEGRKGDITLADYQAVGGTKEALSQHGDELYQALAPKERRLAELIFKRITRRSDDGLTTRDPAPLWTLLDLAKHENATGAELLSVLEVFRARDCRFLMPPQSVALQDDTEIDISHEAVMRTWSLLEGWIADERAAAGTYQRLTRAQRLHEANEGQLLGSRQLELTLQWWRRHQPTVEWARRYHDPDEQLQAGWELRSEEQREWDAQHFAKAQRFLQQSAKVDRRARLRRMVWTVGLLVLVPLVIAAIWAWRVESSKSELLEREAKQARELLRKNEELERTYTELDKKYAELRAANAKLDKAHKELDDAYRDLDATYKDLDSKHEQLVKAVYERDSKQDEVRMLYGRALIQMDQLDKEKRENAVKLTSCLERVRQCTQPP